MQWPKESKNDKQRSPNHAQKTTNPTKKLGELGYARGVSSSCSTSNIRRVTLVKNRWQVIRKKIEDGIATTKNGTYPWPSVTKIFRNV